jgi:hypothetical protein
VKRSWLQFVARTLCQMFSERRFVHFWRTLVCARVLVLNSSSIGPTPPSIAIEALVLGGPEVVRVVLNSSSSIGHTSVLSDRGDVSVRARSGVLGSWNQARYCRACMCNSSIGVRVNLVRVFDLNQLELLFIRAAQAA